MPMYLKKGIEIGTRGLLQTAAKNLRDAPPERNLNNGQRAC